MSQQTVEQGFTIMNEAIDLLKKALGVSFLDSYIETGENFLDGQTVRVLDGVPNKDYVQKLECAYKKFQALSFSKEELRKVFQLVLLKGMKQEYVQPNHQLTPDALGFLFVYLIEQLTGKTQKELSILDIAVGSGNLLLTVLLNLELAGNAVKGIGVDIDDTLLSVAAVNTQWTKTSVQLFHQDGLQPLLVDPVDFAISDLPVGFYPNQDKATNFQVFSELENTYAHHLLMEQSMKYVKDGGYGIFLVPENLFETSQEESLKKWLRSSVYVQAILKLPNNLFKTKQSRKSILVVQNQGSGSCQAKEVLLAELPSLQDPKALQAFFAKFSSWKKQYLD